MQAKIPKTTQSKLKMKRYNRTSNCPPFTSSMMSNSDAEYVLIEVSLWLAFWTHWGCLRLSFIYCWRKCTGFMNRVSSIQHPQSLNVQVCRGHRSNFASSTALTIPPLFLYSAPPSLHPSTSPYLSTYFRFSSSSSSSPLLPISIRNHGYALSLQ